MVHGHNASHERECTASAEDHTGPDLLQLQQSSSVILGYNLERAIRIIQSLVFDE